MEQVTKVCRRCNEEKEAKDFSKASRMSDGLASWCKACYGLYNKLPSIVSARQVWKQTHREQNTDSAWHIRQENQARYLWLCARSRAREAGIPFTITPGDVVVPEFCPVLRVKLVPRTRYAPSLDKIVPKLGYVPGNVQVISLKANTMKSNATPEELQAFGEWCMKSSVPVDRDKPPNT